MKFSTLSLKIAQIKFSLLLLALAFSPLTALAASPGVTYSGSTATQNFGTVGVATASSPVSLSFSVGGGATVGSIEVVTQGAPNLDFTNAGTGTCTDRTYSSTTSCTVEVTFKPVYAGLRRGAVLFWSGANNTGSIVGKTLIYGVGSGGQIVYLPPVITAVATPEGAWSLPESVVVDGTGNLYVGDTGNNRLVEIPVIGSASVINPDATNPPGYAFPGGENTLSNPVKTVVDGAGDLFIDDTGDGRLVEVPVGGAAAFGIDVTVGGTFLEYSDGLDVDGLGNLYVVDAGTYRVIEITSIASNGDATGSLVNLQGNTLLYGTDAWLDAAGDLFISDAGFDFNSSQTGVPTNPQILEVHANGTVTKVTAPGTGCAVDGPYSVEGDAAGNLFIGDDVSTSDNYTYTGRVLEYPAGGGACTITTSLLGVTLGANDYGIGEVNLSASGDIYVSDIGGNRIIKEQRSVVPAVGFTHTTNVGSVDTTDGTKTVQIANIGNSTLDFSGLIYPADFTAGSGVPSPCTSSSTIAVNGTCNVGIEFFPQNGGSLNESVELENNAQGGSQLINVTGTASKVTPSVSANAYSISYGTALSNSQISGTATFNSLSVAGTFAFTSAAGTVLGIGANQSESVTFTPSNTATYNTATTTVLITVNKATPTASVNAYSITYGTALSNGQLSGTASSTVNGSPVSVSGTFAFTSAAGTVLGVGANQSESVTFTPSNATDYTTATTTVLITVSQATPTVSANAYSITYGTALSNAQLSGTASFNSVSVPGTFAFASAAGTVLGAGANQSESVTFTPSNTTNYTTATTTVLITVSQATPTVSVNAYSIPYGTALSNGQLTGTASFTVNGAGVSVPGALGFTSAAGTVLGVGANQSESVTFTPSDTIDYTSEATTVLITVIQPQYSLTTIASPTAGGTITPASGSLFNSGTVVPIVATPATGYTFIGWTSAADPVADATSASTTITMNGPESVTAQFTPNLVVTTNQDDSGTATNCTAQANPSTGTDSSCSLRDALLNAAGAGSANITFSGSAFNAGTSATNTILLTNGTLNIPSSATITGPTNGSGFSLTNLVTVNGNAASSVFTIGSSVSGSSISNLTITNGNNQYGGGVNNSGGFAVIGSTISGNAATLGGAGIYNNGGSVTLEGDTISANVITSSNSGAAGGGILNQGSMSVLNSTFTGNTITSAGTGTGGAIASPGSSMVLIANTISGNSADGSAGGVSFVGGSAASNLVGYNILSGNSAPAPANVAGPYTEGGGDLVDVSNIGLASEGNYGGPTQTLVPLPGSPAICAINESTTLIVPNLATDQRGDPMDPNCPSNFVDSGAVQTNYALAFTTEPPANNVAGLPLSPAPVVTLTESGAIFAPATSAITMTDADSALSSGGTNSAALSSGMAAFTNLIFSSVETGDTLTASLSLNPTLSPALNLTSSASTQASVGAQATLITPTPGLSTVLGTGNVTFQWTAGTGVTVYQLSLGTTGPGSQDLMAYKNTSTSVTVSNLPANGATVYARLSSFINGAWVYIDYVYTESPTPVAATLTTPTPGLGTVLGSSNVPFQWSAGTEVTLYQLSLSAVAPGRSELFEYTGSATSATAPALPAKGQIVYARLSSSINGAWQFNDYQYTESGSTNTATLITPSPGLTTVLGTSNVLFQWSAGTGVTVYQLNLSATAPGASDLFSFKGSATSATVPSLPAKGVTVYARLYSYISGAWQYNDYVYTESGTPVPAILQSPTPGLTTVLGTSNVLFKWSAGTGVTVYQLNLSANVPGETDLFVYKGTATSANVPTLPANGATVYARLYSYINGAWQYNDYVYTEQ
ncbi:MAG: choice-of-anchor Q domain-containing protein [Terracidiphilus sp.]